MKLASQPMPQFGVYTYRSLAIFLIDCKKMLRNYEMSSLYYPSSVNDEFQTPRGASRSLCASLSTRSVCPKLLSSRSYTAYKLQLLAWRYLKSKQQSGEKKGGSASWEHALGRGSVRHGWRKLSSTLCYKQDIPEVLGCWSCDLVLLETRTMPNTLSINRKWIIKMIR